MAEALVGDLVTQLRNCQNAERSLRKLLTTTFAKLPASPHVQVLTIPGIGQATAAAIVGKIVDIDRFATPDQVVGYFGVFPQENSSGVDRQGNPLSPGTMHMSRKGNDLVRSYLWNAARVAIRHSQVLAHLGLIDQLRGNGPQRRGPCPLHSHAADREQTFSVDLGKNAFRCSHAECGAQGNVLNLWAAVHRLPMYAAALHLAETFGLARTREEERVTGTR